ncbi:hypothetical protein [Nocardioides luti]|uniref:hypothetical protein n=1 Tax=Nocardioides luti TaxID=2761101 RepID=UPI001C8A0456|nr:hypothetical protein [Nocardioides luti]
MAKKKPTAEQKLTATVADLRAALERSQDKRAAWKKRATKAEARVVRLERRLAKVEKKARKLVGEVAAEVPAEVVAAAPVEAPAGARTEVSVAATPDSTWTVAQLRDEARRRGLTGLSGKTKAQVLAALA